MSTCSQIEPVVARQARLRLLLQERKLDALVVSNPVNAFYLTGFRGSAGIALVGPAEAVLWVDPRYTLQAQEQARGAKVVEERGHLVKAVAAWLRKSRRARRVGYEDSHLTCAGFRELKSDLPGRVRLVPASGLVEDLRAVKDAAEIGCIREAGRITREVYEEVARQIRPGIKEMDVAAEIEYRMRRKGAEGAAFETIVASGQRSARPHDRASSKSLMKDELVIFDLGAILRGYAADMTRTVFLGEPTRRVRAIYHALRAAQGRALERVRAGIEAGRIDSVARRALAERRLARYFTHSTGHGVGLEVHEGPRLARGEKNCLEAGNVVTIEPGIYIEGLGGMRLEDTVLVQDGGCEILTPASKDDWVVG